MMVHVLIESSHNGDVVVAVYESRADAQVEANKCNHELNDEARNWYHYHVESMELRRASK